MRSGLAFTSESGRWEVQSPSSGHLWPVARYLLVIASWGDALHSGFPTTHMLPSSGPLAGHPASTLATNSLVSTAPPTGTLLEGVRPRPLPAQSPPGFLVTPETKPSPLRPPRPGALPSACSHPVSSDSLSVLRSSQVASVLPTCQACSTSGHLHLLFPLPRMLFPFFPPPPLLPGLFVYHWIREDFS